LNISNSIISNLTLGNIVSDVFNGSISINAPSLSTNPQSINYGNFPVTETRSTEITLYNYGSAELIIDEVIKNNDLFTFPISLPLSIAIGQSETITLTFTPSSTTTYNEDISIRHNGPTGQNVINVLANTFSPNYLKILDSSICTDQSVNIDLNLFNNDAVRAMQFDINFPNGFVLDNSNVTGSTLLDGFEITSSSIGGNSYRFIIYSVSNSNIQAGDNTILNLPISVESTVNSGGYNFTISNVTLSNINNQNIASQVEETGTITIVEPTTPVITLLGENPITIEVGSVFTDPGATAANSCNNNISVTVNSTVDTSVVGSYTITYTATDSSGNQATAVVRTVNVVDTTAPVITLVGDNPVTIELGATYTDQGATATDLSGDITVTTSGTVDTSIVGSYTVTYTATDSSGNSATAVTRTVNVVDTTAPVIILNGDNPMNIEVGGIFTDPGASATDNYDTEISVSVTGTVDNTTVGAYNLTYTATDSSDNTTTVIRIVNIFSPNYLKILDSSICADLEVNNISLNLFSNDAIRAIQFDINFPNGFVLDNSNVTASALLDDFTITSSLIGENTYRFLVYTISDSSIQSGDNTILNLPISVESSVDSGSYIFNISNVTLSNIDNQNIASEVLEIGTLTVFQDCTAPVIALTGDSTVTIELGDTYTDEGATATDESGNITVTSTSTVDTSVVGSYTVTYTATDSSGNEATAVVRTVNVVDTTAPVITITGDDTVTIELGDTYTDEGAAATDLSGDITVTSTSTVDTSVVGSYNVTYTATDSSGNEATAVVRTVIVVDTIAPVITITGDNPVTVELGATYTDEGATATDLSGDITVTSTSTVDTSIVDSYTVTYTAEDSSGNEATAVVRTVNVVDTTAPEVICQNITIELNESGFATVNAEDVDDGSNDLSGIQDYSIDIDYFDCSMIGDNNVTLNVIDNNGNSAQCTSVVTVIDNIYPVAICNNISISLENMFAEISIEDIDNGSYDNCEEVTLSISQTDFDESHIGDNTVILTVTDSGGNTDTCEAIVTVEPGLGIEENILETINIYPNPTANVLYIKSNVSSNYHLYNMVGQKIISGQINEGDNELNLRQYSNGIYFIKFIKNNRVYTKKIIKN
jgi:hypothetical protein